MARRIIAIFVIAAATTPLVYGLRTLSDDRIRGGAIVAVALVAIGAALPTVIGSKLVVVAWLRFLAIGLSLVVVAAMLAVWYFLTQVAAPDLERQLVRGAISTVDDPEDIRGKLAAFRMFAERLLWLAGAVLLSGAAVATLSPGSRTSRAGDADPRPPDRGE